MSKSDFTHPSDIINTEPYFPKEFESYSENLVRLIKSKSGLPIQ